MQVFAPISASFCPNKCKFLPQLVQVFLFLLAFVYNYQRKIILKRHKMELKPINREPNAIVYSKQNYTALEKDIIYHLINQLPDWQTGENWPQDKLFTVKFHKSELNETKHTRLTEALKNLNEKRIIKITPGKKDIAFTSIFPDCQIQNGYIIVQLLGKYVPAFTDLKSGYAVYNILEILALPGATSKRLFEMFSGYKNRRENTFKIDIVTLRQYLGLENKYKTSNANFKKYAIDPHISHINQKTTLRVDYEFTRENKTTYAIFNIDRKPLPDISDKNKGPELFKEQIQDLNEQQQTAATRARIIGFNEKQIQGIAKPENFKFFNSWYANFQIEIKEKWTPEIAKGNYYNEAKRRAKVLYRTI